ncbi:MAG: helix-turn-helix domain-containing protein [Alphaproteobacteria bacterium]|nr:helix-turn-helix domain-containing protein [Alphaproteobacteria bacterium]
MDRTLTNEERDLALVRIIRQMELLRRDPPTLDRALEEVGAALQAVIEETGALPGILETLDEDAADVAAYDAAKAAAGETVPAEVVRRIVLGEHPVKVYREYRGLDQATLGEKAGTNAAYISQIERKARHPSRSLLVRLAQALDVEPPDLITY